MIGPQKVAPLALMLVALGGCSGAQQGVTAAAERGGAPMQTVMAGLVHGDYRALADCTYGRLSAVGDPGLSRSDAPAGKKGIVIALDGAGGRFWELSFAPAGGSAQVDFQSARTKTGPLSDQKAWAEVMACQPRNTGRS